MKVEKLQALIIEMLNEFSNKRDRRTASVFLFLCSKCAVYSHIE